MARAKRKTSSKKGTRKVTKKSANSKNLPSVKEPLTKSGLINFIVERISDEHELTRKQVAAVLGGLKDAVYAQLKRRGAGKATIADICVLKSVKKPAKKARKGINPFTGEEMMFKAKPASWAVKIRPLKKLKEVAAE